MTFLEPLDALIVGSDTQWRDRIAADLSSSGWRVGTKAPDSSEPQVDGRLPAVILAPASATRTVDFFPPDWLGTDRRAGVAIILVGAAEGIRIDPNCDGYVEADHVSDALAACGASPHHALPEATHRLAATFGGAAIRPMLDRFALLLSEALSTLATAEAPAIAHRVAGVAGTLGFAELGQQWLAFSERTDTDLDRLRTSSRMAIGAIRRAAIDAAD